MKQFDTNFNSSIIKWFFLNIVYCILFFNINVGYAQKPTFENSIGPLIFKHCSACHQNGEVAPFALVNYKDVVKHSKMILNVIQKRYMPPWPADPNYSHLAEENYLSDEEIVSVKNWISDGLPEGNKISYTPSLNNGIELNQKFLGKPDLILKWPSPLYLKGDNKESFWIMKVPYELEHDTNAIAIQFIPDNKKLIHHVSSYLLSFKYDKSFDIKKGKNKYNMETEMENPGNMRELGVTNSDGSFPERRLGPSWIPGANLFLWPKDMGGFQLSKQGMFIVNIHCTATPRDEVDNSEIWVYYSKTKPKRMFLNEMLGTAGIFPVLPKFFLPADSIKQFTVRAPIPHDISLLSFNPHMHNLGKEIKAYVIKPNGDTIKLIRINNWNVDYQYTYRLNKILKIEKGSTIYVEATYDNTSGNPKNPFNPPRDIIGLPEGSIMRSTDEMLNFDIRFLNYLSGDENINLE